MTSPDYNPVALIRKKRDGQELSPGQIQDLIHNYTNDTLPDYQMSAFLMAAFLNTLNNEETAALTDAMLHSGRVLDLSGVPGRKVDKHSTGGVGDKLSLILAPIVASCDVPVPMISGRGLGHTGGTLDKLESIRGFTVDISLEKYRHILTECGMVMAGATNDIAPADKKIYALRDVTSTVESIPLIASSIMSKKLAEGIDALVLDVKFGSGAFMKDQEDALRLARTLVAIGEEFGKDTIAYLTNMNQPLGYAIGNWLEVKESIDALQDRGPEDVMEVTYQLAGTMIYLGEKAGSIKQGVEKSKEAVASGRAWKKWLQLTEAQNGDISLLEEPETHEKAAVCTEIKATGDGYIAAMDAYKIGMASLELGAGRRTKEDAIDPSSGIILQKKVGDKITNGETMMKCFTNNQQKAAATEKLIDDAITLTSEKPAPAPMITHKVDKHGVQLV